MLSTERKAQRLAERCAEMKARLSLPHPPPAVVKRKARRLAKQRKQRERARNKDEWPFTKMGRYLEGEAQAVAEERYVTAMWGIRTSWRAIERAAIYTVFRNKKSLKTRRFLSSRPAWTTGVAQRDKHHLAVQAR